MNLPARFPIARPGGTPDQPTAEPNDQPAIDDGNEEITRVFWSANAKHPPSLIKSHA